MAMKVKKYHLSNGKSYSVLEIAKAVNAPAYVIYSRLHRTKIYDRVFSSWKPHTNKRKPKKIEANTEQIANHDNKESYTMRRIKNRGMFDEMLVLALKTI